MMKDKKGFFFILSIFLILSYIMMSLSVWVKGVETSEQAYSEIYKESNIELAVSELTPAKVSYVSDVVMQKALYDISIYSVNNPVKRGSDADEMAHVRQAFYEYFVNGSPSADNFEQPFAPPTKGSSSFGGWVRSLNDSLASIGVFINAFDISDFNVWQESADAVNYSVRIKLNMQDKAGTMRLSRDYDIKGHVNITGYVDPAILRETSRKGTPIYRRFFFGPYEQPSDLAPLSMAGISAGQGWFYGYVAEAGTGEALPEEKYRHLYVLVGTYDEIITTPNYEQFGSYIITSSPMQSPSTGCTGKTSESKTFNAITYVSPACQPTIDQPTSTIKPFVVATSQISYPTCYNVVENKEGKCALIIAGASPEEVAQQPLKKYLQAGSGVFDIEKVRDFTLCGHYMKSSKAPSYLQRLFRNAYGLNSSYGAETFLIGEYVSNAYNDFNFAQYSALDREMFRSVSPASFVRGLTGCKSQGICSSDPSTGVFGLTSEALADYGLSQISCDNGGARCV